MHNQETRATLGTRRIVSNIIWNTLLLKAYFIVKQIQTKDQTQVRILPGLLRLLVMNEF